MKNWIKHSFFIILGLLGFHAPNALAQVDMALCIAGQAGNPTNTKSDTGCIDVLAWSWGEENNMIFDGPSPPVSNVGFQEISITKYQDPNTVYLMKMVAEGTPMAAMELRVRNNCADKGCPTQPIFQLKIPAGSYATKFNTGGNDGESKLTENISISVLAMEWCYTELAEDNTTVIEEFCAGWDVIKSEEYP